MALPASADDGGAGVVEAASVWAAIRKLVESDPAKDLMRAALDLGRGSGRIKALLLLADRPMSPGGLADAMGIDAPYATVIIDSLAERGLVERQSDPVDRRRKLVTLTREGGQAIERLLRIQREPPPGFARLSAAELATLYDLVRRIAAVPDEHAESVRFEGRGA
jgi:DNA-binding MarR family transcriptional regulator